MDHRFVLPCLLLLCAGFTLASESAPDWSKPEGPWVVPVKGWVPVQPGEHPRLFFRKTDLPALRKRAETPEGKLLIARLREQLGNDGEAMPDQANAATKAYDDKQSKDLPLGSFTLTHAVGFGFLYQLTGDKKYAELGKQCMEKLFAGQVDTDNRYSWAAPGGLLRAGPSLGWCAAAYDLCYDGWEPDYRAKVARMIQDYEAKANMSMNRLVNGTKHHPRSNHWGPQVGGSSMALLAIRGDPGTDTAKVQQLLDTIEPKVIKNLSEGFGEAGYYWEGDGPGTISSDTVYVPALQAWRNAAGKDFFNTGRPNASWMTLKWLMGTVVVDGKPIWHSRGGYQHNVWSRSGWSGCGQFAQGFGGIPDRFRPALQWMYERGFATADKNAPFDTTSRYPHRTVLAFVNWPLDGKATDPAEVMPRAVQDARYGYYAFRGRWQDQDDVVVTALLKGAHGAAPDVRITANGGKIITFPGKIQGDATHFSATATGGVVSVGNVSLGCDFSGASGADAVVVMVNGGGVGNDAQQVTTTGGHTFTIMTFQKGAAPQAQARGDQVVIGGQTIAFDGQKLVFAN